MGVFSAGKILSGPLIFSMKELVIVYNLSKGGCPKKFLRFLKNSQKFCRFFDWSLVGGTFFGGSTQEVPETCPTRREEKEPRLRRVRAAADFWRIFEKIPLLGGFVAPLRGISAIRLLIRQSKIRT